MSVTATISYRSLNDASSEAKQVARKLSTYAEHLNNSVFNKLNNYAGSYTVNIADAKTKVNTKITELRNKAYAYTNYSNALHDLKDRCQTTDSTVKTMVSKLTASFKSRNGIKNSVVQNTINYYLTGLKNSTPAGRWINNKNDEANSVKDYIKQRIEDWWDYEGGKEAVKGGVIAALEIVAGVCAVVAGVAALIAGGTVLAIVAAVAGVILGVIGTVNGITNLINEKKAYNQTHNNEDPALGRRYSDENSLQDTLRRETDSEFWHNVATGIDIAEIVCTVITFVNGVGNLAKNAYKWTTGSMTDIKNLRIKDILTRNNFRDFIGKIKMTFKLGVLEIKNAIKFNSFTTIKNVVLDFGDDFINNLKNGYMSFDNYSSTAKTIKNWSSISKTLISKDFSADAVLIDGLIKKIVLPNIGLIKVTTYNPSNGNTGGIFAYKDSEISITDISGKIDSIVGLFESGQKISENWYGSRNIIDAELLNKFSETCDFTVSVPDIKIPQVNLKIA